MKRPIQTPALSLITGAANGLGKALTHVILKTGGKIVVIDRDREKLAEMSSKFPNQLIPIELDLVDITDLDEWTDRLKSICKNHGKFNAVFFNAAISATGHFEKIPLEIHRKIIQINTISPLVMSSALVRSHLMAPHSAMVFVSSLSFKTGYPGAATYAASKDAIAIYAKSIRKEFAAKKIHVMSVFPGPIRTQMAERHSPANASAGKRMEPKKMAQKILRAANSGRLELYPDWIARFTAIAATIFPNAFTKLMRKIIFEKLDKETF